MGLSDTLEVIQKDIKDLKGEEKKPKTKKFRLPFGSKVGKSQAKKNYVTVLIANENGNAEAIKEQIREQTVMIRGIPRIATAEYIVQLGKNPLMVIPSNSVVPINWKQLSQDNLKNGNLAAGYELLMNRMKLSTVEGNKKKMAGWVIYVFGAIILGIIGYALFTGGI